MPACSLPFSLPLLPPFLSPFFWGPEATQELCGHLGRVRSSGAGGGVGVELAQSAGQRWAGQNPREHRMVGPQVPASPPESGVSSSYLGTGQWRRAFSGL